MQIRDRIVELRRVKASELAPSPKNWRRHPKAQTDALRGVLAEVGMADALLARETESGLVLIDGHLRDSLDPDLIWPVLVLDVTEPEADLLLATLDPLAAMAEADAQALDALLRDVSTGEAAVQQMLSELAEREGLDYGAEEKLDAPEAEVDRAADLQAKWQTARGQVWEIGKHRLMCGDSTSAEDVARLTGGAQWGLLLTDIPYNIGDMTEAMDIRLKDGTQTTSRLGEWDAGFDAGAFSEAFIRPTLEAKGSVYVFCAPEQYGALLLPIRTSMPKIVAGECIWFKTNPMFKVRQIGWRWAHENVAFARSLEAPFNWQGQAEMMSVWSGAKNDEAEHLHPTQKPAWLFRRPIEVSSNPGDLILDPFAGSGVTLAAAETTGRIAYGMELEPKYVAVALERLSQMGLTPTLQGSTDAQPARA